MCLPVQPFKIEREWTHAGLSCAVTQAHEGQHRCGYVRVPPGHPMFGKDGDGLEAHGCVNFAELEPCTEHEDGQGWWFGFDCAHAYDCAWEPDLDPDRLSPVMREVYDMYLKYPEIMHGGHYWTLPEVVAECEKLADQLVA